MGFIHVIIVYRYDIVKFGGCPTHHLCFLLWVWLKREFTRLGNPAVNRISMALPHAWCTVLMLQIFFWFQNLQFFWRKNLQFFPSTEKSKKIGIFIENYNHSSLWRPSITLWPPRPTTIVNLVNKGGGIRISVPRTDFGSRVPIQSQKLVLWWKLVPGFLTNLGRWSFKIRWFSRNLWEIYMFFNWFRTKIKWFVDIIMYTIFDWNHSKSEDGVLNLVEFNKKSCTSTYKFQGGRSQKLKCSRLRRAIFDQNRPTFEDIVLEFRY